MAEGCDSSLTAEPVALHQVIGARTRSATTTTRSGKCDTQAK